MTVVSVDGLRDDLAESIRYERGRWGAFAVGLGGVAGGAAFAVSHTQAVAVGAGLFIMALAFLAPYVDRLRPVRSGPPIDPESQIAEVEAAVLDRFGRTDERIDDLLDVMRTRAEVVDGFLATLEGGSQGVAISAADTRARLRGLG